MLLSLIGYILIPLYTIQFVEGSNWFSTNFSVIGSSIDRKGEFVLWGIMVGIYYFYCLRTLVNRMKRKPKCTFLIPASLLLLTAAITTPYLPEEVPLKSFLHVIFSFVAAVCLLLCLYLVVWQLYQDSKEQYRPYLILLIGITLFSGFLLILVGIVSSALEIFFTISTVILVRRIHRLVSASS